MTGFTYIAHIGGGEGPDVWDREVKISGVDILYAAKQAHGEAEDIGGWVFAVTQCDSPEPDYKLRDAAKELLHASRELMGHISDVLDDEALLVINTRTWNALGAAIAKAEEKK